MRIVRLKTADLSSAQLNELRAMLDAAYDGNFGEADWRHLLGGMHFAAWAGGCMVGHAAVVGRELLADGRSFRTGYVEGVAVRREFRGRGIGTELLGMAGEWIAERFELGALSTGAHDFYGRLGWERWRGPAYVLRGTEWLRAPAEDDAIMILRTASSAALNASTPIACRQREGDSW